MATKDEVLTENEDDIDVVEVDALPGEEAKAAEAAAAAEKAKEVAADAGDTDDDDHDDDADHEDARLADADADPDEDNEERKKRLNRRKRQKEARDRTLQRLTFLEQQNAELLKRVGGVENVTQSTNVAQLDARIAEVRKDIATADAILAQAIKDADGDSYATAMRLRDEAKDQERELAAAKSAVEAAKTTSQSGAGQVTSFANAWKAANPWYDPSGGDNASAVVNAIDAGMIREGYDPNQRGYWEELTRRVAGRVGSNGERRETRAKENGVDKDPPRRKAPPLGANRDGNGQGGRRQVFLSKERVDAIKSAGLWDDPTERAKMIKAYEEYDRDNPASR